MATIAAIKKQNPMNAPSKRLERLGDRSSRPTHFADWANEAARSSL